MEPLGNLPAAFAVWAAVVGMIGVAIVWELSRLRTELRCMAGQLNEYILGMERRVGHIESHMQILSNGFRPVGL